MRLIRLFIAASLDGFIARKDGSVDWLFEGDFGYEDFYRSIDTAIMGRKTYDMARELEPGPVPLPGKQVYVFSRTPHDNPAENAQIITDIIPFLTQLVQRPGADIWLVGGSEIISLLLQESLLDEVIVSVHPLLLGEGIPLFKDVPETRLRLKKTIPFPNGLLQAWYDVIKES